MEEKGSRIQGVEGSRGKDEKLGSRGQVVEGKREEKGSGIQGEKNFELCRHTRLLMIVRQKQGVEGKR